MHLSNMYSNFIKWLTNMAALNKSIAFIVITSLALSIIPAYSNERDAADNSAPSNFSELLRQAETARNNAKAINKEREAEFKRALGDQQKLLDEAKEALNKAQAKSEQLRVDFVENQTKIADAKKSLVEIKGDLSGVFSAARDASGSLQATIAGSLLAADHEAELKQLAELSATDTNDDTRSPAELNLLASLLLKTAIATGEVKKFNAPVVTKTGNQRDLDVVRIGVFNAISGPNYLEHIAEINSLQILTRQPSETQGELAKTFARSSTPETMVVDPTKGNLLTALVSRPGIEERIHQGGIVGYVIIGVAAVGLLIIVLRLITLIFSGLSIWRQRRNLLKLSKYNALGRVLLAADYKELTAGTDKAKSNQNSENLELLLDEAVLKETPRLERGLPIIKLLAAVAPLLGLLGTVVGMIETFYKISIYGNGDPKLMADGISQALVTTMLGLIAAIPLLGSYVLLWLLSNRLIHTLDQESAALLVRHFEQQRQQDQPESKHILTEAASQNQSTNQSPSSLLDATDSKHSPSE